MNGVSKAVELFRNGCACSQALLAAYGPRYGLSEPQALRVASGFAGGMRMAGTCGAVTGAYMVIGLAKSGSDCNVAEGRQAAYDAVVAFSGAFRERQGSLTCRELLGCDISTPEGAEAAREAGLFQTKCADVVRCAAELVEEILRTDEELVMAIRKAAPRSIDDYISAVPSDVQPILEKIRRIISRAAPAAEEIISYRMPAFRLNAVLVYFAAFKNHVGLYPPVSGDAKLEKALRRYAGPKGNLKFPLDQPIPYALIKRVALLRVKQASGRGAARRRSPSRTRAGTSRRG